MRVWVEYAGFKYRIENVQGQAIAILEPYQHPAGNKFKHRQAAIEQWREDGSKLEDLPSGDMPS